MTFDDHKAYVARTLDTWRQRLDVEDSRLAASLVDSGTDDDGRFGQHTRALNTEVISDLALEMAHTYSTRRDVEARSQAQTLLASHAHVAHAWSSVIKVTFDRYLHTLDHADLNLALVLVALYDQPVRGRDFLRIIYPIRTQMKSRGIDAGAVFDEAVSLTVPHDDPLDGAYGLFTALGKAWDLEPDLPSLANPSDLDALIHDWDMRMRVLELDPDMAFPDLVSLAFEIADIYRYKLDDPGRRRAHGLLTEHPALATPWVRVIGITSRHYRTHVIQADLDLTLTLIAAADLSLRDALIVQNLEVVRGCMRQNAIDPTVIFRDALSLTTRHADPGQGAFGLFATFALP